MKAICCNIGGKCEHNIYELEFEVNDLDSGSCPECGGTDIAPAWLKNYRIPGEEKLLKERKILHEKIKEIEKIENALKNCVTDKGEKL